MRKILLLAILMASFASLGATYFVDFVGGNDANNGTSAATPWQHCPGDGAATGNANATTLAAGDKVTFKGGVNYLNTVVWKGNGGTRASPITLDGNTAGTFGTGRAIFNGQDTNSMGINFNVGFAFRTAHVIQYSNIVIQGFQFTRYGGHGTWNPANITWTCLTEPSTVNGWGILAEACDGLSIGSCLFTNIGDWTNAPFMSGNFQSGYGIHLDQYNSNCWLTNNEFTEVGNTAIRITTTFPAQIPASIADYATNIYIGSNNIHDYIQWGIQIVPNAGCTNTVIQDIIITNNSLHDMWEYSPSQWKGCAGEFPHTDGIFLFLGYSPPPGVQNATIGPPGHPLVIANNDFYCNVSITNDGGTANIFCSPWAGQLLIYNNQFRNVLNMGEGGILFRGSLPDPAANGDTPLDVLIANNSFYDQTFGMVFTSDSQATALTNGSIKAYNNVFYHDLVSNFALPVAFGADDWSRPKDLNFNGYFTIRADQVINTSRGGGAQQFNTFAQLQAIGLESKGFYGDPKYVDITHSLGPNTSLNDLHLQAGSPATGTGTNLSAFFTKDILGGSRTVPWSMGAFASTSDPAITLQPQNQTVNVGQTATFSVTASGTAPITYYWYQQGVLVQNGATASYTTASTDCTFNQNQYFVVVSNSVSKVTSTTATLTVNGCQGGQTNYISNIGTCTIGTSRF